MSYSDPYGLCPIPPSSCLGAAGLSFAVGLIPVVGDAVDIAGAIVGEDLITGEQITGSARAATIVGTLGGSGRAARQAVEVAQEGAERAGKAYTRAGKRQVIEQNRAANGGVTVCAGCGRPTVPAQQHKKGVTPPGNETHVDHIVPQSKGGAGSPPNGQVLCRDCNIQKSDN